MGNLLQNQTGIKQLASSSKITLTGSGTAGTTVKTGTVGLSTSDLSMLSTGTRPQTGVNEVYNTQTGSFETAQQSASHLDALGGTTQGYTQGINLVLSNLTPQGIAQNIIGSASGALSGSSTALQGVANISHGSGSTVATAGNATGNTDTIANHAAAITTGQGAPVASTQSAMQAVAGAPIRPHHGILLLLGVAVVGVILVLLVRE